MYRSMVLCLLFIPFFSFSQISTVELQVRPVPKPATLDTDVDSWNRALDGYKKLSGEAKAVLYWTNYCRNNPEKFWDSVVTPLLITFPNLKTPESRSLKTDLLKTGPLPMFTLNATLIGTAQSHANDICRKPSPPSHTSTNGIDFGTRMNNAGIKYCASENMSLGNQDVLLSVLLLYLDIGLPELGHRKTLLNPTLVEMGVDYSDYAKGQFFIVEDFACAQK